MKKLHKRIVGAVVAALLLAGAGGGGYWYFSKNGARVVQGTVITVKRGSLTETASASGTIEPHVQVEVKSRTSGEVIALHVDEGAVVKAGQLLVELDPTDAQKQLDQAKVDLEKVRADIAAARASLGTAQLDSKNSQADKAVAEKSATAGLGSSESVRTATHAQEVAAATVSLKAAQLSSTQTQLKAAELAVKDAETKLSQTKIYAPMDGTVLDVGIEKGTIVSSALTNVSGGTTVMTIADLSDLRIIGAIDEAQIGKVAKDQSVDIRVDAYPDRVFKGKVDRISPLGKTVSNVVTFDVEIIVTDDKRDLLRSGMSADVEILTHQLDDVLLVPLASITSSGQARFVTMPNGQKRKIKTGANDGAQMVVLEGLEEGESILETAPSDAKKPSGQSGQSGAMRMGGGMGGPPPGGR